MASPTKSFLDLCLLDSAQDLVALEADYVEAMTEAVTYRDLFFEALSRLSEELGKNRILERRLRQSMGQDPWRNEEADGVES